MFDFMAILVVSLGSLNSGLYLWLFLRRHHDRRWLYLLAAVVCLQWTTLFVVTMTHLLWNVHLLQDIRPVYLIRESVILTMAVLGAMALQERKIR